MLLFRHPLDLAFSGLQLGLESGLGLLTPWAFDSPPSFGESFVHLLTKRLHLNILTYWALVGMSVAVEYYRKYKDQELLASQMRLKTSQLEARLAHAQLNTLKMQLQPHFLFNTLHAISALVHEDARVADQMISSLSDLLRLTIKNSSDQEVTLRQELDFLRKYIEIEGTRFQDRLSWSIEAPEETLDAFVPNLLLQPLVENSIRHGITVRYWPGWVAVESKKEDGMLHITIRDNGEGLPSGPLKEGIGLSNIRARLEHLYGFRHLFEICNVAEGGVRVTIVLPFRLKMEGD